MEPKKLISNFIQIQILNSPAKLSDRVDYLEKALRKTQKMVFEKGELCELVLSIDHFIKKVG